MKKILTLIILLLFSGCVNSPEPKQITTNNKINIIEKPRILIKQEINQKIFIKSFKKEYLSEIIIELNKSFYNISKNNKNKLSYKINNFDYYIKSVRNNKFEHRLRIKLVLEFNTSVNKIIINQDIELIRNIETNKRNKDLIKRIINKALFKVTEKLKLKLIRGIK